jgi:hypothetical protein
MSPCNGFACGNMVGVAIGINGFVQTAEECAKMDEIGGDGAVVSEIEGG